MINVRSLYELNLIDFPFPGGESALHMASQGLTGLRTTSVFHIVVADRKLRIRLLYVRFIHNVNITTTKHRPLIRIVGYCELSQIQIELLPEV